MKRNSPIKITKEVFNYLLALLVALPIVNSVDFLPDIGIDLLWLAVVTTLVGTVGYSKELWRSLREGQSGTSDLDGETS